MRIRAKKLKKSSLSRINERKKEYLCGVEGVLL